MVKKKQTKKEFLGVITVKEMKDNNLAWPDKFGDNTELNWFIQKKFSGRRWDYEIHYNGDNKDLRIYKI